VKSAAACFVEKGFHQTSVRDIASKAGVSVGNLYNHFASKVDLIAEIAALEAEELGAFVEALAAPGQPIMIIERFVGSYFDYVSLPENAVLATEITAEAVRNPEIAEGFLRNRKILVGALTSVLNEGKRKALFDFDEPSQEMANLMLDIVEGAGVRAAFNMRARQTQTRKSIITMSLRMLIR